MSFGPARVTLLKHDICIHTSLLDIPFFFYCRSLVKNKLADDKYSKMEIYLLLCTLWSKLQCFIYTIKCVLDSKALSFQSIG
jgi:hypothetical protein